MIGSVVQFSGPSRGAIERDQGVAHTLAAHRFMGGPVSGLFSDLVATTWRGGFVWSRRSCSRLSPASLHGVWIGGAMRASALSRQSQRRRKSAWEAIGQRGVLEARGGGPARRP